MSGKSYGDAMITLENHTAIVTGAGRGIGAGIASALAAAGAAVVVNYRTEASGAERVVQSIVSAGGRALAVRADVRRGDEVAALFAATRTAFGAVNLLVNNAVVARFQPLTAVTEEDYRQQFDTNVWGAVLTIQEMAAQEDLGSASILNISTADTTLHPLHGSTYVATKAALETTTIIAAKELGPRGIRVNAIAPSFTDTESTREAGVVGSPRAAQLISGIALGRAGTPEDYGPVAVFLASDAAHWITGAVIHVSGGQR
jgi:3-oxoacyl-[acyl-carrier protein] reductase